MQRRCAARRRRGAGWPPRARSSRGSAFLMTRGSVAGAARVDRRAAATATVPRLVPRLTCTTTRSPQRSGSAPASYSWIWPAARNCTPTTATVGGAVGARCWSRRIVIDVSARASRSASASVSSARLGLRQRRVLQRLGDDLAAARRTARSSASRSPRGGRRDRVVAAQGEQPVEPRRRLLLRLAERLAHGEDRTISSRRPGPQASVRSVAARSSSPRCRAAPGRARGCRRRARRARRPRRRRARPRPAPRATSSSASGRNSDALAARAHGREQRAGAGGDEDRAGPGRAAPRASSGARSGPRSTAGRRRR